MSVRIKKGFSIKGNIIETTSAVDSGQSARERSDAAREARIQRVEEARRGTNQPLSDLITTNADNEIKIRKRFPRGVDSAAISERARRQEELNLLDPSAQIGVSSSTTRTRGSLIAGSALRLRNKIVTTSFGSEPLTENIFVPGSSNINVIAQTFSVIPNNLVGEAEQFVPTANDIAIQDNILSNFDNVAYNFRFFVAPEKATHETISSEDTVTIAETGSTGFNITEAQINSVIGPSPDTRNAFAQQINFTIIEPHGNTLFDKIRNSAVSLGVFDHKHVPFWFEVSFKGYISGEDSSHEGGGFADLSGETRLWRIQVRSVEVEINKGGTLYNFKCVPFNEAAYSDASRRLEKNETIEARTVGTFFEKLANRLNEYSNYSTVGSVDDTFRIRKYAFSFPPKSEIPETIKPIEDWILRADNKTGNIRSEGFVFIGNKDGESRITFAKGTSIESIIQTVLSVTLEAQSLATHGEEKSDVDEIGPNTERDAKKDSVIFVVDPTVDILSYNAIVKNYNTVTVYHIRPYRTFTAMLSRKHIEDALVEKEKERFVNILKVSRIRKKYEYMYSGLNTEVLDYKIQFNNAWFVSLPLFQGQDRAALAASSTQMNKIKSDKRIVQDASQQINSLLSEKAEIRTELEILRFQLADQIATNSEITEISQSLIDRLVQRNQDIDVRLQETRPGRRASQVRSVALARIKSLSDINLRTDRINTSLFSAITQQQITSSALTSLASETRNVDFLVGNDIIGSSSLKARERIVNRTKITGNGSIFFVEDFDEVSIGRDITEEQLKEIFIPGTELLPTGTVEVNAEGTAGKGRSFFSAIYNQVYGLDKEMLDLNLEIRGDPYWLGESNEVTRVTESLGGDRNLLASDSTILLTFAGPKSINDGTFQSREDSFAGTGLFDINREQNGFNALYFIKRVESTFSNGKFTQKLTGPIDPYTREQSVIDIVIKLQNREI